MEEPVENEITTTPLLTQQVASIGTSSIPLNIVTYYICLL